MIINLQVRMSWFQIFQSKAQMSLRMTYYPYLDLKSYQGKPSLQRWLTPCVDTITIPVPCDSLLVAQSKILLEQLNSVCRLQRSSCIFIIQLNSSIYLWFPDLSARQPQSQGKVFDKFFAPNRPTLESLYEQIPPPRPNAAWESYVESAVMTRAGRVEIRHIPVVYHLP